LAAGFFTAAFLAGAFFAVAIVISLIKLQRAPCTSSCTAIHDPPRCGVHCPKT
jgi:hypothetical protein